MNPVPRKIHDAGFTLVELLVSMVLLSLLSVFTVDALFRFQRMKQLEESIKRDEVISSARHLLQKTMSGARVSQTSSVDIGAKESFAGEETSAQWINTLDDRLVFGGIYGLAVRINEQAHTMEFSQREGLAGNDVDLAWKPVLEDVDEGQFAYFGVRRSSGKEDWASSWHEQGLPRIVKMNLKFRDGREELIVVAVETAL